MTPGLAVEALELNAVPPYSVIRICPFTGCVYADLPRAVRRMQRLRQRHAPIKAENIRLLIRCGRYGVRPDGLYMGINGEES